jgi:excisionase family DNA binding protein
MPGKGGKVERKNRAKVVLPMPVIQPLAYSVAKLAEAVSLSRSFLYEEMRAERLAFVKKGNRTLITYEQAKAWLELPDPA